MIFIDFSLSLKDILEFTKEKGRCHRSSCILVKILKLTSLWCLINSMGLKTLCSRTGMLTMCGNVSYASGQVSNNTSPQMSVYAADCLYLFHVTRFVRYIIILFCNLLCQTLWIRLFHLVYKQQLNCVNIPCFFF